MRARHGADMELYGLPTANAVAEGSRAPSKRLKEDGPTRRRQARSEALREAHRAEWWQSAACRGMPLDIFFPRSGATKATAEVKRALAICESCPVKEECLEYALEDDGTDGTGLRGIWAGTTFKERRRLRRERQQAAELAGLPVKRSPGSFRTPPPAA